jgi:hypothetical protein
MNARRLSSSLLWIYKTKESIVQTNYLEKVAGLNVQKRSPEWNEIKKLQVVRNAAVHRDGRLKKEHHSIISSFVAGPNKLVDRPDLLVQVK